MKKEMAVNTLVLLISILAVFFLAEVIMRFNWEMGGWVKRPIYQKSMNPYLRYELVPGAKTTNMSINSAGFRGPECPLIKPKGTFRVIMLGDSETFSIMLDENQTLPRQLESLLNSRSERLRYEVLNFGVEGYGTLQELEQLKTKGMKYDPDLIILNYVLNDPEPGEYYFNKSFFMRHSCLVRYLSYRIKKTMIKKERKKLKIKDEIDNYYYYHQMKYFLHVQDAISDMARISKRQSRKLAVVIFPVSSIMVKDFRDNYPYKALHTLVKNIGKENNNIVFIDLIDEFNRLGLTPQNVAINYIYDESHKNAMALGVCAEYIYSILKTENLIPG
ncbi:MAG: hypothetical protein WC510_00035 [Candidatus Omnitrophota bacterium]